MEKGKKACPGHTVAPWEENGNKDKYALKKVRRVLVPKVSLGTQLQAKLQFRV
jgi:hypothetical protein